MTTNKTLLIIAIILGLAIAGAIGWIVTQEYNGTQEHSGESTEIETEIKTKETTPPTQASAPVYFIAIHNEPYNSVAEKSEVELATAFENLTNMVELADEQNVKLTLMLSASWAEYILSDTVRTRIFEEWVAASHEIAGHHHSITHGSWDGYSNLPKIEAVQTRAKQTTPEPYHGTLEDYTTELKRLNPSFNSGCMNEEKNKDEMPDSIIYSTCSGFSNHTDRLVKLDDSDDVEKGDNQHVLSTMMNGKLRYWLAHYNIGMPPRAIEAIDYFKTMEKGAFGMVLHSTDQNQAGFQAALTALKELDPDANQSRTLTQIIESNTLPLMEVSEEDIRE